MNKEVIFILFGATGDLAQKKILPALEQVWLHNTMSPHSRVVAVSRRDWNDSEFVEHMDTVTEGKMDNRFKDSVIYSKVDIETGTGYDLLANRIKALRMTMPCAQVLVHVSLAPQYHPRVLETLCKEGIIQKSDSKVLIEKPFGTDEKTAEKLNTLVSTYLAESNIYRIDHYLGKQASQDIMNGKIEHKQIKSVYACLFEKHGIEARGASYDGVGAFRDVGQNHLLEMVALVLANHRDGDWQSARTSILKRLIPPEKTCSDFIRGQYDGYLSEKGVSKDSTTETAFRVVTMIDRISITLEAGKKMSTNDAYVLITYTDNTEQCFDFRAGKDAYITILHAALRGSKREFVGYDEVLALWRYSDHVSLCWNKIPLVLYGEKKPFLLR